MNVFSNRIDKLCITPHDATDQIEGVANKERPKNKNTVKISHNNDPPEQNL